MSALPCPCPHPEPCGKPWIPHCFDCGTVGVWLDAHPDPKYHLNESGWYCELGPTCAAVHPFATTPKPEEK